VVALSAEPDPRTRRAIATAIGTFRRPEAADALVALLSEDLPTWQLEGAALHALGHTRDPRAREVIEARCDRPSWADWIRQRALEALAETEDPAVFEVLVAHTRAPHADRTRGAAATAIGRLADAVEEVRRPGVERLIELSIETGFRAQLLAIAALGRIRDPKAEAALSRIHQTAPDGRTRRSAYEALVQVRRGRTTEQGLTALRRRLDGLQEENVRLRERIDRLER
jgi:HEAT repeat protein